MSESASILISTVVSKDLRYYIIPVDRIAKKQCWRAFFVNSALKLKIQCHIVKDTLLQTAISAILPS